ncbi:MAG TPA: hypothetical protein VMB50_13125 [Myxococcales bacterium]|nr:hypothetical protein [Myxococcales bacterium]
MSDRATDARRLAVFLHSGDYDRLHQGAAIAAAGAAAERDVEVFFFWWALQKLVAGELSQPSFEGHLPPGGGLDLEHRFEDRAFPTAAALLAAARETGRCRLFACTASMELLGLRPPEVEKHVDSLLGWQGILARTEGVTDRFYL